MRNLIAGDIIEGEEAMNLLRDFTILPWKAWVKMAIAYMEAGDTDQALSILKELLEKS